MYTLTPYNSTEVVTEDLQEARIGSSELKLYHQTMSMRDNEASEKQAMRDKETVADTMVVEEEETGTNSSRSKTQPNGRGQVHETMTTGQGRGVQDTQPRQNITERTSQKVEDNHQQPTKEDQNVSITCSPQRRFFHSSKHVDTRHSMK